MTMTEQGGASGRQELNESEKTELRLQWLFNDLIAQKGADEIVEWNQALGFKLRALRYLERGLVELGRNAPDTVREEMKQQVIVLKSTTSLIFTASLNLEFFFYLGTAVLDLLAKLTKRFYARNEKSFRKDKRIYFTDIIRVFTTTGIDKEFGKMLSPHEDWIASIYNNRNILAHSASVFVGFDKNYNMVFEKRRPDQTSLWPKHENANLVEYVDETISSFYIFLEKYLAYLRNFVPETENTRFFREQLEAGRLFKT
jgi:hypothetical protein